ncbi:MAG: hypothetical protein GWN86_00820 [Desulfobacterales bacterium]|nr:hypothetical protein [Desulfobacterales bacterium]
MYRYGIGIRLGRKIHLEDDYSAALAFSAIWPVCLPWVVVFWMLSPGYREETRRIKLDEEFKQLEDKSVS